jgi:hypothetical protein
MTGLTLSGFQIGEAPQAPFYFAQLIAANDFGISDSRRRTEYTV